MESWHKSNASKGVGKETCMKFVSKVVRDDDLQIIANGRAWDSITAPQQL